MVDSVRRAAERSPNLTPPPDHEADVAHARYQEDQARKALEKDRCPPCYPADLGFPLENIPKEYKEILSYWKSLPGTGHVVLVAQHSDWRSFRDFQRRIRRHYLPPKCLHRFQNEARDRRRRHALEGDVCLQHDPAKQTQMENWVEFQNFHLTIHERFEKEVMEENKYLIAAQKKSAAKAQGAEEVEISKARLKTGESKVIHHELLLHWTEQHRKAMAIEHMPSINNTQDEWSDELKTYWADFIDGRRKRPPKARPLLSPVQSGVSKNKIR
ncbi:MAG: hypothetical protein Q9164_001663 [Protoblastenia rupestris]